jgi:molecular chaperone HscB
MTSYFQLFSLPERFSVDLAELERRYHEGSKLHHPDRHAKADGAERVKHALATAELNQGYRVLRDPMRRAEHLVLVRGGRIDENAKGEPAFLMEMMEQREALAEARAAGDEAAIAKMAGEMRARRGQGLSALGAALDAGQTDRAAGLLGELRYYGRFLDEIALHEERKDELAAGEPR